MAMNFPNAPTVGERFQPPGSPFLYEWDGVAWNVVGGGGSGGGVTIGPTPPASPAPGDQWYNDATGRTMVWFEDVDSGQWVESAPGVVGNPYEPGGMYLFESVDLTGLVNYDFELLPNYDYDIEIEGAIPSIADNFVIGALSEDGGANFPTTDCFWTYQLGNVGGNVSISTSSGTTILLCGSTASSATGRYSAMEASIRNHDSPTVRTGTWVRYLASGTTVTQSAEGRAARNTDGIDNAFRVAWNNYLTTSFTAGKLDIYRRNRSLK